MTQSGDLASNGTPLTFQQLTELYYARYKPLYNQVQSFNEMPIELVFEVAAAWDHVSRCWKYGESEASCADKASRHMKRAILDAFKLIMKARVDDYDELRRIDTSLINNGDYDRDLRALMSEIQHDAVAARTAEGDTSLPDSWERAFDSWDRVHAKCERFHREFYLNANVEWAKRKTQEFTTKRRLEGYWINIAATVTVTSAVWLFAWLAAAWWG
jgi:hypothetical protein